MDIGTIARVSIIPLFAIILLYHVHRLHQSRIKRLPYSAGLLTLVVCLILVAVGAALIERRCQLKDQFAEPNRMYAILGACMTPLRRCPTRAFASHKKSSRTRCGCTIASTSATATSKSCSPPAAWSSPTKPYVNGAASSGSSTRTSCAGGVPGPVTSGTSMKCC